MAPPGPIITLNKLSSVILVTAPAMELENPTSGSHTFLLYLEMTNNQSLKSTDDIMICYLRDKDKTTSKHVLNIIGSLSISEF